MLLYTWGGSGIFDSALVFSLFMITRQAMLVITAVTADDRNPVTNTDTRTTYESRRGFIHDQQHPMRQIQTSNRVSDCMHTTT